MQGLLITLIFYLAVDKNIHFQEKKINFYSYNFLFQFFFVISIYLNKKHH